MNDSAIRDPNTANCRIYVGGLKENTSKEELKNIFGKYGTVRGIMVSRNFGFIQFENEQSVNNAIDNENQKMYNGRKIAVSKVQKKGMQKQGDKSGNIGGGNISGGASNDAPIQNPPNNAPMQNCGPEPVNIQPQMNPNNNNNNNSNIGNIGPNNNMNQSGPNNNNMNNQHQQNPGNHPQNQRQNWMRNRNANRNNNDMNLHTDRERSPFDGRRDSNNDRWNQDGGNSNFNNFRNNNRNNNNQGMHRNNNNNNMNMNNMPSNNAGNNMNMGNMGNMESMSGMRNTGNMMTNMNNSNTDLPNVQSFGVKTDVKNVLNGGVLQGYASAREIRAKHPNANDCEIVVLEKHLVDYAEFIESRLKRGGITADLLFPNADLTMGKMLSNIANRGSLYAVIIQSQHKENNSVTVNILYGIPAEHRNMPLEDALTLIFRNYQHLCQGENGDVIGDTDESPYASIPLANSRNPDSIQHLVNLLADNRTLTVLQLDCLLKYLQERRESQYKFELGDTDVKAPTADLTISPKTDSDVKNESANEQADAEKDIEKKLLEILSKPSIPNLPKAEPMKTTPEKKQQASTSNADSASNRRQQPNLLAKDPKLRNVLDSLMLDDI